MADKNNTGGIVEYEPKIFTPLTCVLIIINNQVVPVETIMQADNG